MDIEKITGRVCQNSPPEMYLPVYRFADRMAKVCESPIEVMLAAGLFGQSMLRKIVSPDAGKLIYVSDSTEMDLPAACIHVIPQCSFSHLPYRVDFIAMCGDESVIIECDGHDFHERTPEQAEHDRRRDRELQKDGWDVLRFTGREIYRSPIDCSRQAVEFLTELVERSSNRRKTA